jgi:ATP-binding cassette subfamily B protein
VKPDTNLLKRLLGLAWKYRGSCLLPLSLQVVLLCLGVIGLRFAGLGIDILVHALDARKPIPRYPFGLETPMQWTTMHQVLAVGGAILSFSLMRGLLNLSYTVTISRLIQGRLVVDLRAAVYDKLQRLSFRFYDSNETGSLINRVTGDVQTVSHFINGVVLQVIVLSLSLSVYLTYMLRISPSLTLACLITTPLLWYGSLIFSRTMKKAYRRNRELYDKLVLVLVENLQGIHVVKGFNLQKQQEEKFLAANLEYKRQQRWIFWRNSLFGPSISFLTQVNLAILLGYGGWLVITGRLQLGADLMVFIGLLGNVSGQVQSIANLANSVQQSLVAAKRVFDVLDLPLEIQSRPNARRLPNPRGKIEFRNVSYEFTPGRPVLRDVSFVLDPGQALAITGPTGCGKSVLLSLIPRFYEVSSGQILIDNVDIRDYELNDLRRAIGVVFQETFLFSNTIANNIAFGVPGATREQIAEAARIAKAEQFIAPMPKGYDTILTEGGNNLSGGQRQRLAMARALILHPAFLLMDDPMAAVDAQTEHEMSEAMESAMSGRTTLIAANRISTLRRSTMILVLQRGRIVQRGTHEQLMASTGYYRETARLQLDEDQRRAALAVVDAAAPVAGGAP